MLIIPADQRAAVRHHHLPALPEQAPAEVRTSYNVI